MSTDKGDEFTYTDILGFMKENPDIKKINERFTRNEGLEKSIREDHIVEAGK